jgi:hypothetical protein
MFCSNCGSQVQSELNYCNRCGAKVAGGDPAIQKTVAENLSSAIGYIGGFGLLAFIFVVYLVLRSGGDSKVLIPVSFFYLAALVGICWLLLHQISELTGKPHSRRHENVHETAEPAYIKPATTAQLGESTIEPASVTENTTRTLDEVLIERK